MNSTTITLHTEGGEMPVYEVLPDTPNGCAVIVVQEAFGVNSHIEDVTRRFGALGYRALAPHLFHRLSRQFAAYDDPSYVELLNQLSDPEMLADIDAVLDHLDAESYPASGIAIVGFCMGGRVSFLVAAHRTLGAAVGFYGGGIAVSRRPNLPALVESGAGLRTPWLGLFGAEDPHIPLEEVDSIREAVSVAPVDTEVHTFEGAGHGFHCDDRPAFEPTASAAAWALTLQWLDRHLSNS
jgi:carboxymethylenebutenolidase